MCEKINPLSINYIILYSNISAVLPILYESADLPSISSLLPVVPVFPVLHSLYIHYCSVFSHQVFLDVASTTRIMNYFIMQLMIGSIGYIRLLDCRMLDYMLLDCRLLDSRLLDSRLLNSRLLDFRLGLQVYPQIIVVSYLLIESCREYIYVLSVGQFGLNCTSLWYKLQISSQINQ